MADELIRIDKCTGRVMRVSCSDFDVAMRGAYDEEGVEKAWRMLKSGMRVSSQFAVYYLCDCLKK